VLNFSKPVHLDQQTQLVVRRAMCTMHGIVDRCQVPLSLAARLQIEIADGRLR
jgi:hypothetical protein